MYMGHTDGHTGDVYCMWNKRNNEYSETRDVIWLNHMFYEKREDLGNKDINKHEEFWIILHPTPEKKGEEENLVSFPGDWSVVNTRTKDESRIKYTTSSKS